jgi:3-dehydroquinate synthase
MDIRFNLQTERRHQTEIIIGQDVFLNSISKIASYNNDLCFLIVDENVKRLHPDKIEVVKQQFDRLIIGVVPSGEQSKSQSEFDKLIDTALRSGVKRNTPLIAMGGGVTGDLAGYVASSLLRGVPLYHFPTTVLAMVDSSIGGKTGINHVTGKNLIGAFYQPQMIIMDISFLESLPQKEWNCGLGEILKYGCISDFSLFDLIDNVVKEKDSTKLIELIERCARIKVGIVQKDELESGMRAFLNFGHTFAHALESCTNYTRYAHGEAVYIGLIGALYFSKMSNPDLDISRLLGFVSTFKLETLDLVDNVDELIMAMYKDKKVTGNSLKLIALHSWESPELVETNDIQLVKKCWIYALEQAHFNG